VIPPASRLRRIGRHHRFVSCGGVSTRPAGNGRTVGNPWFHQLDIHIEAALEFLGHDLELQPSLAGDDRLADRRIEVEIKCRVLFTQGG
jgi:hypothetical protein